jgi:branched-chain amino acid transport system permease protein
MVGTVSPRPGGRHALGLVPSQLLTVAALAGGTILVGILPSLSSDYVVLVSFRIFEYAALAQAWNLLAGYGGLVSLGSAAFIGIGMYGMARLTISAGMPVIPAMLIGGGFAALFALVVSPVLFRLRGLYFVIATLVLAQALQIWMFNWNHYGLNGSAGLFLTNSAPTPHELYWLGLAVAAATTVLLTVVLRTRLGLSLRALRDNEDVAQQMGLWTFRTKLWVFVISAYVMGVVGGLQADFLGKIEPGGAFSLNWTVDIVTIAIIGGMGTTVGPLVGAVFVIWLGEKLAGQPEIHIAITGAILIAVIRFAPYGIWGTLERFADQAPWRRLRKEPA